MKDIIKQSQNNYTNQILKFSSILLSEKIPHWHIEKSNETIGIAWYDDKLEVYGQKGIILAFINYEYKRNLYGFDLQVLESCNNYFATFQSRKIYNNVFCIENIDNYSWLHNYLTLIAQDPISPLCTKNEINELNKNNIQIFSTPDSLNLSKKSIFSYTDDEFEILNKS